MKEPRTSIIDPARGSGPHAARAHNERLVLALVRRHGSLSKAEIARRTGLSPQSATVITRRLEDDGLLRKGRPERGRVGQPAVPLLLNPKGAISLGIKVGRRNIEFMAIDLGGEIVSYDRVGYAYPKLETVLDFAAHCIRPYADALNLTGIGVAIPWQIWGWLDDGELEASELAEMERWRDLDIAEAIGRMTSAPVLTCNDATAAARAENAFGLGRELIDYATVYVGHFIGGGVVIDHRVHEGRSRNAAAFGTLPFPNGQQLLELASLSILRRALVDAGHDPDNLLEPSASWTGFDEHLEAWIERCASALASACVSIASVIEIEAMVIEGQFPERVKVRLTDRVRAAMDTLDTRGIERPRILPGTIGHLARVRGAAAMPLFARHFIDD